MNGLSKSLVAAGLASATLLVGCTGASVGSTAAAASGLSRCSTPEVSDEVRVVVDSKLASVAPTRA